MEKEVHSKRNYLDKYLFSIRSHGRYTFTLEELKTEFHLSSTALNQSLHRLKSKNEIAQIRKGFYAIIPPEYSQQEMLPIYFILDDLMKSLDKKYYLALLSASALYGAAHQQPMEFFVIVESPAPRSIKNKKLVINFLSRKNWQEGGIIQQKTNLGYINVSSPELTALDFFDYSDRFGINRIVSVLQELTQEMKPTTLTKAASRYSNTAAIQRLGYLLENVISEKKLADSLYTVISNRSCFIVPLSPKKEKKGEIDSRWKIIKNMKVESDI